MTKIKKTNKKTPKNSFLEAVIDELKLPQDGFSMIGYGAHLQKGNPFQNCLATRETLVSYMVVDASTFLFVTVTKGLREFTHAGYKMATLPGPGPNGQGGVTFVLATGDLSIEYNSSLVIWDFLNNLIDFQSYMNGAVSLNIMAYLASAIHTKDRFFKQLSYDWVKSKLWRNSNVGRTLFVDPHYVFQGINVVNETRGVSNWGEFKPVLDKLFQEALTNEETDEDVLEYHRLAALPNFIDPRGVESKPAEEQEPLFQEIVEPNPNVVAPYNPDL